MQKAMLDRRFWQSSLWGVLMLTMSGLAVSIAQDYGNRAYGNPVGDLILDNLPPFPWPKLLVNFLIWGSLTLAASVLLITLANIRYFPATAKTIALLYFVRAFFISLTHLKVHSGKIVIDQNALTTLLYGSNDLFFSGHTALPFVTALIFWKIKAARYCFLATSALFAAGTLLAKSHYSIDVFVVPFMSYGVYKIAQRLFRKDFEYCLD